MTGGWFAGVDTVKPLWWKARTEIRFPSALERRSEMSTDRGLVLLGEPRLGKRRRQAPPAAFRLDTIDRVAGEQAFDAKLLFPFLGAGHPIREMFKSVRPIGGRFVPFGAVAQRGRPSAASGGGSG